MPAGTVCVCGNLTQNRGRCDSCAGEQSRNDQLRRQVYGDARWTRCKLLVWARDGWTCVRCGKRDVGNRRRSLDAHHTTSVLELLARGLDPFNPTRVETLCKTCHGGTRT